MQVRFHVRYFSEKKETSSVNSDFLPTRGNTLSVKIITIDASELIRLHFQWGLGQLLRKLTPNSNRNLNPNPNPNPNRGAIFL